MESPLWGTGERTIPFRRILGSASYPVENADYEDRMTTLPGHTGFSAMTLSNTGQQLESLNQVQFGVMKGQWGKGIEEIAESG